MAARPEMTMSDWALLVLLSVLWGGSFFFAKVIVQEVPPLTLVLVRFASAAVVLGGYIMIRGLSVPGSAKTWAAFVGMGVLNNLIPVALISWAQKNIASGLASVLIATTPVFSILVAHCATTDERLSANKVAGVLLAIAGVAALVGVDTLDGSPGSILAILGCLVAALSYGCANVFGRRFRRMGITPVVGAFGQLATTAVMIAPVALAVDRPWRLSVPSIATFASMLGLVLLSTALAYAIFFRLLARAGTTNVSFVTFMIPVSAIVLGSVVLGEQLAGLQFAGMGLIGVGLIATDGRAWAALRSERLR